MNIELTEGTGKICSILNDPHWVKTYASPDHLKVWQMDLRIGKLGGKTLSQVRGMVMSITGSGVFSENEFALRGTLGDSNNSDCHGSVYRNFHNPISSGELVIASKGNWIYSVACSGELEFDTIGDLKPMSFSASGEVRLDYVSVRGLLSEPLQNLLDRYSAHYDLTRFETPVEGNSICYDDGEQSRELIFYPKR